ncbi:hypothetical protein [Turicibacter sanguinis]|uniref:hypothetical protein n=1 Tax=Turicibacter sanguinis TaxID=154288 RepID=UPI0021D4F4CD|nr:hypothetical protein [Turicibacter sanguinis]MCU7195868.1 hypothetical protein [Turicibacter sanguinis]
MEITTYYLDDSSLDARVELEIEEVDICPLCNHAISARECHSVITKDGDTVGISNTLNVLFLCPKCKKSFLAKYTVTYMAPNPYAFEVSGHYATTLIDVYPKTPKVIEFDTVIRNVSPKFIQIYNESLHAETLGLFEVAGPGYRKAFEFLIKDYLIYLNPKNQNDVKADWLSNCIKRLDYQPLTDVCERALWLGNDQTHYVPIYEEYNLNDLKDIIMTAVSWIVLSHRTQKINSIERRK